MARIAFIGTGGTFSNEGTSPSDYLSYLHAGRVLPAAQVLELMPDLRGVATLEPVPFAAVRSKELGPAHWVELARIVERACDDPSIDGVILAHGTGVLEETAYFLHLTVNSSKPIAVIGAQRPPTTISSDAQKNLLDAAYWVRDQQGAGVVAVMDQEVHSARGVAKLANHTLGAMESPAGGLIARVNPDGTVTHYRSPRQRHTVNSEFARGWESLPRVDIVHQYAGADAAALDACVRAGARGVVAVGFPPGTNTPAMDEALRAHAREGIVIVQASRAIRDPHILPREDLGGFVRNTDLSPQQARILLMLALARGYGAEQAQRVFSEY